MTNKISFRISSKVYPEHQIKVSNIDYNCTENQILQFFSNFSSPQNAVLINNEQGKFQGKAFLIFNNEQELQKALNKKKLNFQGKLLHMQKALSPQELAQKRQEVKDKNEAEIKEKIKAKKIEDINRKTLYVGNFPFFLTEYDLIEYFEIFGQVHRVKILKDNQDKSRGAAFIFFQNEESVQKCLQKKQQLYGRQLNIQKKNLHQANNEVF